MRFAPHDAGFVRWYVFIPGEGRFVVPPEVSDREAYALASGATRLYHGNDLQWSRPVPDKSGAHLAVVR